MSAIQSFPHTSWCDTVRGVPCDDSGVVSVGAWLKSQGAMPRCFNIAAVDRLLEQCQKAIRGVDFKGVKVDGAALAHLLQQCAEGRSLEELHMEEVDFRSDDTCFGQLADAIRASGYRHWLYVQKRLLADGQFIRLSALCNDNYLKGLQVHCADYPDGVVPGFLHMNQTRYNAAKDRVVDAQVRWTLTAALRRYAPIISGGSVIDFGAGQSPELRKLAREGIPCAKLVAVDHEEGELHKLAEALPTAYRHKLETYCGPFIAYQTESRFTLFLASFTLPYRPSADFGAIWGKMLSLTADGGVMAFHLFGAPRHADPAMTYHTFDDIVSLLLPVADEFEIVAEDADGRCEYRRWTAGGEETVDALPTFDPQTWQGTAIVGGEQPQWGTLFHVVARKKTL